MIKALLYFLPFVVIVAMWAMSARERRFSNDPTARSFLQRNGAVISTYLLVAVGFWAIIMIVLPQLIMIDFSFHPKLPPREYGGPKDQYTLENYRYFLYGSTTDTSSWNNTHLTAFYLTILASIFVTFVNFCLCYPLAFYMAQVAIPRGACALM
jgi:spermidine/putrescine transport system permease protein